MGGAGRLFVLPAGNDYMFLSDMERERQTKIMDEKKNQGFPQDSESNEYRYISAAWLDEIAVGLTAGAVKHPGETWRTIPTDEHLARAMRHINLYRKGDRSEPHLVNASMRLMMAFCTKQNEYGEE